MCVCVYVCVFMYICMYVCACVYVCVPLWMRVHACVHLCVYGCVHLCACTPLCVYRCVHLCRCVHICAHLCVYMDVYISVYVYVYICVDVRVHICVHLCVYMHVYLRACVCVCMCAVHLSLHTRTCRCTCQSPGALLTPGGYTLPPSGLTPPGHLQLPPCLHPRPSPPPQRPVYLFIALRGPCSDITTFIADMLCVSARAGVVPCGKPVTEQGLALLRLESAPPPTGFLLGHSGNLGPSPACVAVSLLCSLGLVTRVRPLPHTEDASWPVSILRNGSLDATETEATSRRPMWLAQLSHQEMFSLVSVLFLGGEEGHGLGAAREEGAGGCGLALGPPLSPGDAPPELQLRLPAFPPGGPMGQ